MADRQFTRGDIVEWSSHAHNVEGEVEKRITDDTQAAGRQVRASDNDPQYRVTSDKTGADAVHKPDALRPTKH
jgi:Hypervirulence associated proteins TUDOR domain